MEIWYAGAYIAPSEMSSSSPTPGWFNFALTFCGPGAGAWWQRARRSEQLGCQHRSSDQHRWQAQQGRIPKPHVSQVLRRSPHLETRRQDSIVMFLQELPHMHICFSAASRLNSEMFLKIQKMRGFFFSLLRTYLSFVSILTRSTVKWRTGCRDVLVAPPWKTDRTPRPRVTEPAVWRASALQTRDWLHR